MASRVLLEKSITTKVFAKILGSCLKKWQHSILLLGFYHCTKWRWEISYQMDHIHEVFFSLWKDLHLFSNWKELKSYENHHPWASEMTVFKYWRHGKRLVDVGIYLALKLFQVVLIWARCYRGIKIAWHRADRADFPTCYTRNDRSMSLKSPKFRGSTDLILENVETTNDMFF